MITSFKRTLLAAGAASLVMTLAACGGGGDPTTVPLSSGDMATTAVPSPVEEGPSA